MHHCVKKRMHVHRQKHSLTFVRYNVVNRCGCFSLTHTVFYDKVDPSRWNCACCCRHIFTAVLTVSSDKWCHIRCSFSFGKSCKSVGVKSGKCCLCSKTVKLVNLWKHFWKSYFICSYWNEFHCMSIKKTPGSSVSIVSDYGLDDRAIGVRSTAEAKDFCCSLCVQTGSSFPSNEYRGTPSPELKRGRGMTLTTHPI
jgi:hypothetical protein